MAALDYPDLDASEPATADVLDRVRQGRPFVPNLYRMLLHSPGVAGGWVHLANEVRFASTVDDRTRELAILLVSRLAGCAYEWHHHAPLAARAGVSDEEIERVRAWPRTDGWAAEDRMLLEFVAAVADAQAPPADVVSALRARLGQRTVVELAATVAYYGAVARFLIGLGVEVEQ